MPNMNQVIAAAVFMNNAAKTLGTLFYYNNYIQIY